MNKLREKTLGEIIQENRFSTELKDVSYKEAAAEMSKSLPSAIMEAVRGGLKEFKSDFYIEILMKIHRHLGKVFHPQIVARKTCPRPNHSELVYKYTRHDDKLEILWALPPKNIAYKYMQGQIDDGDETQNLQWVVEFETGVLHEKYKKLRDADNKLIEKV